MVHCVATIDSSAQSMNYMQCQTTREVPTLATTLPGANTTPTVTSGSPITTASELNNRLESQTSSNHGGH